MAGGNESAFGYRYQYVATTERFLRNMRDHLGGGCPEFRGTSAAAR